jgi:hypothetical protein
VLDSLDELHLRLQGQVHQPEFIPICHIPEDQNYLYLHLFTHAVMHLFDCNCFVVFVLLFLFR